MTDSAKGGWSEKKGEEKINGTKRKKHLEALVLEDFLDSDFFVVL